MGTEKQSSEAAIGVVVILLVLAAPLAMLHGWVLSVLWRWFITPFGVQPIGVAWCIGISLLVGMFRSTSSPDNPDIAKVIGRAIGGPLIALGMGAIVRAFM